jgi:hypothetical protein
MMAWGEGVRLRVKGVPVLGPWLGQRCWGKGVEMRILG